MIRNKPLTLWNWLSTKIDKSYLKLLGMVLGAVGLIFFIINLFPGTPEKQLPFGDIVYHNLSFMGSDQKFLTEKKGAWHISNLSIVKNVNFFGNDIQIKDFVMNHRLWSVSWGPNGDAIGFAYYEFGDNNNVFRPGIMDVNGNLLTCPEETPFAMNNFFPIQLLDNERIVIAIGVFPYDYLALYNMRTCKEEAVYFDHAVTGFFTISSTDWLAISETNGTQNFLNIYDEQKLPIVSIPLNNTLYWAAWSKDGTQLLFRDSRNKSSMMFNYNFLTGETTIIGEKIISASYSPDGNWIVYYKDGGIYLLNLETGEDSFLAKGSYPQWRP